MDTLTVQQIPGLVLEEIQKMVDADGCWEGYESFSTEVTLFSEVQTCEGVLFRKSKVLVVLRETSRTSMLFVREVSDTGRIDPEKPVLAVVSGYHLKHAEQHADRERVLIEDDIRTMLSSPSLCAACPAAQFASLVFALTTKHANSPALHLRDPLFVYPAYDYVPKDFAIGDIIIG